MSTTATIPQSRILVRTMAVTLFTSAFLLFWCQPMIGKMVLPHLGGTAAVWTTCVLFFQAMLLAGYVYAHLLGRIAPVRTQILIHGLLLIVPLGFLPLAFDAELGETAFERPAAALLLNLLMTVGVPFFVVSASAPLLQNWIAGTSDAAARDPYFLYAASNAGSLLALLIYPAFVEPEIGVTAQSSVWFAGYLLLLVLIALGAAFIWRAGTGAPLRSTAPSAAVPAPALSVRLFWVAAAFVASGLMLAVTNHITADLTSAPFLWILPLAIYLVTFIIAFAQKFRVSADRATQLLPVVLLLLFPLVCADIAVPTFLNIFLIAMHLLLLFAGALYCHSRLAESRPESQYLTEFYFWLALGGVLGGVFTATIAPLAFNTILEYPLLVMSLAFLRMLPFGRQRPNDWDFYFPALVAIGITLAWIVFRTTNADADAEAPALVHTVLLFALFKFRERPVRFALSLSIVMLAYTMVLSQYTENAERVLVTRNFFGTKKILQNGSLRSLLHGDTTHGVENTDPAMIGIPLSYYNPAGAIGDVMQRLRPGEPLQNIGIVGLGTGTLAAYTAPGRHMTFFDIDPQIETIARDYFTFLGSCGDACSVVIGDGRLQIEQMPDNTYDLLMLDAFSSDSIPAHLLSREAVQLYLRKLRPDGLLLFHVSNRYLDVESLVTDLVLDADLLGFQRVDTAGEMAIEGYTNTNYIIAARQPEHLGIVPQANSKWQQLTQPAGTRVWTDDYSSLLQIIRWR